MHISRQLVNIAAGLLIISTTVGGCAYQRYMGEEVARGEKLKSQLNVAKAEGQAGRSKTIALEAERKQVRDQVAANKRTLRSLETQRKRLVAKPGRTSGEEAELERIRAEIVRLEKQNAEKQQRLDNLNKNI